LRTRTEDFVSHISSAPQQRYLPALSRQHSAISLQLLLLP
jgi:hypothetical protein